MNMNYQLLHEERLREIQRNLNHELLKRQVAALNTQRQPLRTSLQNMLSAVSQQAQALKNRQGAATTLSQPEFPPVKA